LSFFIIVVLAAVFFWGISAKRRTDASKKPDNHYRPQRVVVRPKVTHLSGRCWVIDGDTIVIGNDHLRLAGIDAPELDHPYGQNAKWAMVKLCRGHIITAQILDEMSHNRLVAICTLPDGRDLAAELVKQGLAIDWPKYSGGRYRQFEHPDARKKHWRAAARQNGKMPTPAGSKYESRVNSSSGR
jgi:micrococcal nuclease